MEELVDVSKSGPLIEGVAGTAQYNERLVEQAKAGVIGSEQGFFDPKIYLQITQPLNATGAGYAEIEMLDANWRRIGKEVNTKWDGSIPVKVFWGIGNGDSEMRMLMLDADRQKGIKTISVDSQRLFLQQWWGGLANLSANYRTKIEAGCYNQFFEDMCTMDFCVGSPVRTFVVFGNTTGNYLDQEFIFRYLADFMSEGERLVLGVQLSTLGPDRLLSAYRNGFYDEMLESIKARLGTAERITWTFEKSDNSVRAYIGDKLGFCSKKYSVDEILELGKIADLERRLLVRDSKKNNAIVVFRKTSYRGGFHLAKIARAASGP